MKTLQYDVVAIGSGFGSAPVALRLAEAGFSVLVIEKGPAINPEKDFKQSQNINYLQKYYKQHDGKGFGVTAVEALGGGSGFYLGISLRAPSFIFDSKDYKNNTYWPSNISRPTLDPYYKKAEDMLSVNQIDTKDVSKNGQLFSQMMSNLNLSSDRTRLAVTDCKKCGFCVTGCTYNAKQSLLLNYIPKARAKGVTYITEAEALSIKPLQKNGKYKYELTARIKNTDHLSIQARVVTLGAGAVGTAKFLLKNKDNLPNLSSTLGKTLTGNVFYTAFGALPKSMRDGEMFKGNGLPGTMSYEFLESHKMLLIPYKTLPIQMMARVRITLTDGQGKKSWWGQSHANMMKSFKKRMFILTATSFLQDYAQMNIDSHEKLRITYSPSEQTVQRHKKNNALLKSLLAKNGLKIAESDVINWEGKLFENLHYNSTHPVGSARMAIDEANGVIDENNEVFNYKGLFVTDASAIPSPLIVPPTLTILAMAERATESIMNRLQH